MKLAFCFLIREDFNKTDLWIDFFKDVPSDLYEIYIHRAYITPQHCDFVKKYTIREYVKTKWAGNLYDAVKLLYKHGIEDNCDKFILLSESHVPVRSFKYVYDYLSKNLDVSHISYLQRCPKNHNEVSTHLSMLQRFQHNCRRDIIFAKNIDVSYWYFNEMWTILKKDHVKLLLDDNEIIKYFKHAFAWDENYPMYILSLNNQFENIQKEETSFVNWKEPSLNKDGKRSPKIYTTVTKNEFDDFISRDSILFVRKIHKESNIGDFIIK